MQPQNLFNVGHKLLPLTGRLVYIDHFFARFPDCLRPTINSSDGPDSR